MIFYKGQIGKAGASHPVLVVTDGEFGYENTAFGVPVKLGSNGVEEVGEWKLDEYERELMDEAAEKLSEQYDEIA